jgi:hypothetical protein
MIKIVFLVISLHLRPNSLSQTIQHHTYYISLLYFLLHFILKIIRSYWMFDILLFSSFSSPTLFSTLIFYFCIVTTQTLAKGKGLPCIGEIWGNFQESHPFSPRWPFLFTLRLRKRFPKLRWVFRSVKLSLVIE